MNTLQHIDAGRSHTIWQAHHLSPYSFETCILDAGRTTTYGKHSATFRTVRKLPSLA
jgi:hypothetical protein